MILDRESTKKLPPKLVLTALLSTGITIVASISYIILSIIALVYRFNCDVADPNASDNAQFTWHTIYRIYFQDPVCNETLPTEGLTQSDTVFVLVILTLCSSVLTLISSILLIVGVKYEAWFQYTNIVVFAYVTCWVGSLAVDLTFATHLGMDYGYLTRELRDSPEYIFVFDVVRQGALVLMSVTMKGYVTLFVNLILICILITYSCRHQDCNKEQHSIHKVGAINGFDQPRRLDDNWAQPDHISPYATPYARGQTNSVYTNDDDQPRSLPRSDYYPTSSQSFNRSDSWQHQPPNHGTRPFSYMDDIRRGVPLKPPVSPASQEPQWRREPWPQAPPVPAPDYSPHGPRRLKSALKPAGYM